MIFIFIAVFYHLKCGNVALSERLGSQMVTANATWPHGHNGHQFGSGWCPLLRVIPLFFSLSLSLSLFPVCLFTVTVQSSQKMPEKRKCQPSLLWDCKNKLFLNSSCLSVLSASVHTDRTIGSRWVWTLSNTCWVSLRWCVKIRQIWPTCVCVCFTVRCLWSFHSDWCILNLNQVQTTPPPPVAPPSSSLSSSVRLFDFMFQTRL